MMVLYGPGRSVAMSKQTLWNLVTLLRKLWRSCFAVPTFHPSQLKPLCYLSWCNSYMLRGFWWQAFGNLLKRMLEASGRGMWQADANVLDKLKGMYSDLDNQLEGV